MNDDPFVMVLQEIITEVNLLETDCRMRVILCILNMNQIEKNQGKNYKFPFRDGIHKVTRILQFFFANYHIYNIGLKFINI